MDIKTVEAWVEGYRKAWDSNDPKDTGALFAGNAAYYTGPFNEPWRGRQAIVEEWLKRKDEPGSYTFRYEVLAVTGDVGVVRGWTTYLESHREYSNIWVIHLDGQGRCTEFAEWWMKRKEAQPANPA